jgi:flagellar assembly protein FliH
LYGNPRFGYGVYKKSQVNLGDPFAVTPPADKPVKPERVGAPEEEAFVPVDTLEKARREAALILREAEMESGRMLEQARDKIVLEAEDAQRRAREEGYKQGEQQAQQQYQALIAEAEETLEAARAEYRQSMASMEQDMVTLVVDIARKVIGGELETRPEVILSLIRSTLEDITPTDQVTVKVSAEDHEYVMAHLDRLTAGLPFLCELDVRKDASLPKGGCIIDTGRGTVDGSLPSRMQQIEDAMRALLIGRPEIPVADMVADAGEE